MFGDFHVEGFRCFESLSLEGLERVNLIVGRNSVGKSVLLEALRLYTARADPLTIRELLVQREDFARGSVQGDDSPVSSVSFSALFHGWPRDHSLPATVTMRSSSQSETLRLALGFAPRAAEPTTWPPEGPPPFTPFGQERSGDGLGRMAIRVQAPGQRVRVYLQEEEFFTAYKTISGRSSPPEPIAALGPGGVPADAMAAWWDKISLTDGEQRVVETLRLIAPVEKVALVQHHLAPHRIAMARVSGIREPVPLRVLGDGATRLFGLALAIERSREAGLLLIDEIENGIHHSVLPKVWRVLLHAAEVNEVQVFATSHSWDCLTAFQRVLGQNEAGVVVRLSRRKGRVEPTVFSAGELAIATRDRIEVR